MRVIKKRTIIEQFDKYPDVEEPLKAWLMDVLRADWASPQDIKERYPKASILADNRVVFDIIFYPHRMVYIKFFGTHAEYDKIDAVEVDDFRSA